MIFANDKKYACESCIKGHRSSSCSHNDRPLFEVKKKGRPVSQCEKCRELRKTKRFHSKCKCGCSSERSEKGELRSLSDKSKRFIPILPTLPNGIQVTTGQTKSQNSGLSVTDREAPVPTLSAHSVDSGSWKHKRHNSTSVMRPGGLETLAKVAALCCSSSGSGNVAQTPTPNVGTSEKARLKRVTSLPPILSPALSPNHRQPIFPKIPPLSSVASLAGTGCTCGFDCTCPGCAEHRGLQHIPDDDLDCPDECGSCIDNDQGMELPPPSNYGPATASAPAHITNFVDTFLARAVAKIPPPPALRLSASAASFDPMNVTVYPRSLFSDEGKRLDEHGPAFGPVKLPKLECCAGKCGCPGSSCGCGNACNGCCLVHSAVDSID